MLKAKVVYGTKAVKPAKYEYRPVYDTHNMVIGFMTPGQIGNYMPRAENYDKVLVAVPGTDIEEMIKLLN